MKKTTFNISKCLILTISIMTLAGCGKTATTVDVPSEIITESKMETKSSARQKNITIESAAEDMSYEVSEENAISIDAGDSKLLETTIDRIAEQLGEN